MPNLDPVVWAAIIGAAGGIFGILVSKGRLGPVLVGVLIGVILGAVGSLTVPKIWSKNPPARILEAPLAVTVYFYPSGFMGDGAKNKSLIQLNTSSREAPRPNDQDGECIKISYRPGGERWAGIYWQYPDSNWGDQPGSKVLKCTRISFWARGATGTEKVEFKAGGINTPGKPFRDSFEAVTEGPIHLESKWNRYEISLKGKDLSQVIGAFAWTATADANPQGVTFYLDDIRYE